MCDQRQKGTTAVYFAPACPIRRRLPKGVFGCCTSPPHTSEVELLFSLPPFWVVWGGG